MTRKALKIFKKRITQNGLLFHEYLDETDFPDPERLDERGPKFQYPNGIKSKKIRALSLKIYMALTSRPPGANPTLMAGYMAMAAFV